MQIPAFMNCPRCGAVLPHRLAMLIVNKIEDCPNNPWAFKAPIDDDFMVSI